MEFITLAEFKAVQNITSPNQDAEYTLIINAVNGFMESYLGFMAGGSATKSVYLQSSKEFLDDIWASITSITSATGEALTFTLVRGYILILDAEYVGNVTIVGTLAANTVVPALKQAALSLVKYYLKDQYMKSISNGMDSVALADYEAVPAHIKSILDMYRVS